MYVRTTDSRAFCMLSCCYCWGGISLATKEDVGDKIFQTACRRRQEGRRKHIYRYRILLHTLYVIRNIGTYTYNTRGGLQVYIGLLVAPCPRFSDLT